MTFTSIKKNTCILAFFIGVFLFPGIARAAVCECATADGTISNLTVEVAEECVPGNFTAFFEPSDPPVRCDISEAVCVQQGSVAVNCAPDEVCIDDSYCVVVECVADTECEEGQYCDTDNFVCLTADAPAGECTIDLDCEEAKVCVEGRCLYVPQPDDPRRVPYYSLNPINGLDEGSEVPELIGRMLSFLVGIYGSVTLVLVVYGGLTIMTSGANSDKVKKGSRVIMWAAIAFLTMMSAYALARFVLTFIV